MCDNPPVSSDRILTEAPVVLCAAPTGARRTKKDHPALPLSTAEIARDAVACAAAGASAIHLHVRNPAGEHTLDVNLYRETLQAIRAEAGSELLLQVTTEAVGRYSPEEQMAVVRELKPEAISIALQELIPDRTLETDAAAFLSWASGNQTAVQYILYSADEILRMVQLKERGVIPDATPHALFVLGRYTPGQRSRPRELFPFLDLWPKDWPWTVCAFGPEEPLCMAVAIGLGGNVRIGFENNLNRPDGTLASSNAELIANAHTLISATGRPLASTADARRIYGARQ